MNEINFLKNLFFSAVNEARADKILKSYLPPPPKNKTFVVSIGKAGAAMAEVAEKHWQGEMNGIAIVPDKHVCKNVCKKIKIHQASHPLPDKRGQSATQEIIQQVKKLKKDDLLLLLISGGGSALMNSPIENVLDIKEKININNELLLSGAKISEINIVRKHLSQVKGGQLAKMAQPAKVVSFAISDVPQDDPATIASGPSVADPSTLQQAQDILQKYNITISEKIKQHLANSKNETPKPNDKLFANSQYKIIYRPSDMLCHIEQRLLQKFKNIINLGADIEGEARLVGKQHGQMIKQQKHKIDFLISGGETSVSIDKTKKIKLGTGGRNMEYLLALAIELNGAENIYALAADTDGIDGKSQSAGAILTPDTLARGKKMGMDAQDYLEAHDSFSYFKNLNNLITTGPTLTNVNDLRIIYCLR